MNKIVLNFGLFVFFVSVIILSQSGIPLQDVLVRAFALFVVVTIMAGILVISFVKAINKMSERRQNRYHDSLMTGGQNEE